MKKWNRTAKIKAILLVVFTLPNLLVPFASGGPSNAMNILIPFIFASIAIPLLTKLKRENWRTEFTKPDWNDNPLSGSHPLTLSQFAAYFFITLGMSLVIGSGIKYHILNFIGLSVISFGLGILVGIWILVKLTIITKKK